ncbi:lysylphosphatidylglycerol synthase domain-containing protein [Micromonospora sp. I033]
MSHAAVAGPVPAAAPAPARSVRAWARPLWAWARPLWAWARPLAGLALLAALVWSVGTGPFLAGLRLIDAPALAAALGIGAVTTVCCAWRWSLVAGGLGVRLPLRAAVAHCYRAVFLNSTLPGGVLGDVHRAVRHGRDAGDVARGVRAVVWERGAGQVVQLVIAVAVLAVLPSPVRPYLPAGAAGLAAGALALALAARAVPRAGASRWARAARTAVADVRAGLLARRTWLGVVAASAVVVAGHLATFVVAARTAGADAPLSRLLPLTLLALLAMGLPTNVGGFGPREGVAAWAFAAAGLTAGQGVATGTVYGALVLVASLPGAAVLLIRRRPAAEPGDCR